MVGLAENKANSAPIELWLSLAKMFQSSISLIVWYGYEKFLCFFRSLECKSTKVALIKERDSCVQVSCMLTAMVFVVAII